MIFSKLKTWGVAILGFIVAILYAMNMKQKKDYAELEKDMAEDNAESAEMQKDQLQASAEAARIATVDGQEETKDAVEKAESGDFSGLNR